MAKAADAAPIAPANAQVGVVLHAAVAGRQPGNQVAKKATARPDAGDVCGVVPAMGLHEIGRQRAAQSCVLLARVAGDRIVGGANPEADLPARAQPMRQPDVVRVHVGDDHAQHRQTLQFLRKQQFPLRPGFRGVNTAVHNAPAGAAVNLVPQQPQVDVVQREGQSHADPFHAGGNHDATACRW